MRILFMGTPEFAVPSLEILHKNHEIIGVFTKVDKPNTRGGKIKYTPVKEYALNNNIPVYQPNKLRDSELIETIKEMNPDLIVVVAYGKIIPNEIIDIPKYGIINVHSSLLPKFRGAAPINAAIVAGESETGVTIMSIVEELDAGDMIEVGVTPIYDEDNFITLHDRLKEIGAKSLLKAVNDIFAGKAVYTVQDHSAATFVRPFKKEDLVIDFSKDAKVIRNFVRGMTPFPGVFTTLNGKILKVLDVDIYDKSYSGQFGEVVDVVKGRGFVVKCGDTSIILKSIKPENKGAITGADSINGKQLKLGDLLI